MLGAVIRPSSGVPEKPGIAMPPSPPAPGAGPSWAYTAAGEDSTASIMRIDKATNNFRKMENLLGREKSL